MSDELLEVKADGEDSETMDPIDTGSTKRPKDKDQGQKTAEKVDGDITKKGGGPNKTAKNLASVKGNGAKGQKMEKVREALEKLFDDDDSADLSEHFKHRVSTLFEAALVDVINAIEEELEAEYQSVLESYQEDMMEQMNEYATFVATEWAKENRLQIENGIKAELAESFIEGLQELMAEHNVVLPEDQIDVVAEMTEEIEELKQKLNESHNKLFEMALEKSKDERKEILNKLSEGLAETQVDKLETLAESISYDDMEEFEEKLTTIKEKWFGNVANSSKKQVISEELDESVSDTTTVVHDPFVARIAEKISKSR